MASERQLMREKLLFNYSRALERADWETVAKVLRVAQRDLSLAQMIAEVDEVYQKALEARRFVKPASTLNHNHHKKDPVPMIAVARPSIQPKPMFSPTMFAAVVVLTVFVSAAVLTQLNFNKMPQGSENSGVEQIALSATPLIDGTPWQCTFVLEEEITLDLYAEPNGSILAEVTLTPESLLTIEGKAESDGISWYFINVEDENGVRVIYGWVIAAKLASAGECVIDATPTPIGESTAELTPTPLGEKPTELPFTSVLETLPATPTPAGEKPTELPVTFVPTDDTLPLTPMTAVPGDTTPTPAGEKPTELPVTSVPGNITPTPYVEPWLTWTPASEKPTEVPVTSVPGKFTPTPLPVTSVPEKLTPTPTIFGPQPTATFVGQP